MHPGRSTAAHKHTRAWTNVPVVPPMTDSTIRPAGSAYEQAVAYINASSVLPDMVVLDAGSIVWRQLSRCAAAVAHASEISSTPC